MADKTGHVDKFCAEMMPPVELWPVRDWSGIPELAYPDWMNCAGELLDSMVESKRGTRTVFRYPGGTWTYQQLFETANRIAQVLVEDLGLVPGNRVLLRGPNNRSSPARNAAKPWTCSTWPGSSSACVRYSTSSADIKSSFFIRYSLHDLVGQPESG